jgi:membrane protein implicated in regulation of membrane protease activity
VAPRLVACIALSALVGGSAAALAVAAGWNPVIGLLVYSATGSVALVLFAILAALVEDLHARFREKPPADARIRRSRRSEHVPAEIA